MSVPRRSQERRVSEPIGIRPPLAPLPPFKYPSDSREMMLDAIRYMRRKYGGNNLRKNGSTSGSSYGPLPKEFGGE